MKKQSLFSLLFLLQPILGHAAPRQEPVVGAYYENWSQYRPAAGLGWRPQFFPSLIDPTIVTDIYYAFAFFGFITKSVDPNNQRLTGDYKMQPVEWNDQSRLYGEIQALKKQNPKLRTLIAVGGWSFNDPEDPNGIGQHTYQLFSQMVAMKKRRTEFINSAVAYARQYGFDGIDIDWEYPGDLTRGGRDKDFPNFVEFLRELHKACHAANPPLLVTYASPAIVPNGVSEKYHKNPELYFQWLAECSQYVDRLNVMAYDYHGAFDNPQLTGVNSPLNRDTDPASTFYVEKTLSNYIDNGVPANKIVLGIPTYGRCYSGVSGLTPTDNGPGKPFTGPGQAGAATGTPGFLSYFEIADMNAKKEFLLGFDSTTSTPYGYNTQTGTWVTYEQPDTVTLKAQKAKEKGLLGIMFWAVDDDEYAWGDKYPNIRAGYKVLYNK